MSVAVRRQEKRDHSDRFCPYFLCLWRTEGGVMCARHVNKAPRHRIRGLDFTARTTGQTR